jgi:ATP-binding cassette subfamily B protein
MSLPQGYATHLADGGVNLSKGQRQLITIARAMLSKAPMLILDEATSNVDSRTEHQIQDAMMELMRGKTCFVIAHRLSTVQHADNILVLKDGNIIEHGTHEQLLCAKGFYASLYGAQFVN